MNQSAYLTVKPRLMVLLLLSLGLAACETNVPEATLYQENTSSGVTASPSQYAVNNPSRPNNLIYCKTTFNKSCDVNVFDGINLNKLSSSKKGAFIGIAPSASSNLRQVVFLSAQGAEPQVKMLASAAQIQLTLSPMHDLRSSFLIGCIGRVASGPAGIGLLQHDKPIRIVLQRGRSRQIIYTDIWGVFKTNLPSGRYIMHVGNQHKTIDVPVQDSVIATIILQRMLQN